MTGNVYSEVVEALLMIDRTGELENYYFIQIIVTNGVLGLEVVGDTPDIIKSSYNCQPSLNFFKPLHHS